MRSVFTFLRAERGVVTIGLDGAAIFGFFFKPILGKTLAASVTMRREPLN